MISQRSIISLELNGSRNIAITAAEWICVYSHSAIFHALESLTLVASPFLLLAFEAAFVVVDSLVLVFLAFLFLVLVCFALTSSSP
jgi:hypothetical protein